MPASPSSPNILASRDLPVSELLILSIGKDTARCRRVGDREPVTLCCRGLALLVPGQIATVRVRSEKKLATRTRVEGDLVDRRTAVEAFDLARWAPTEEGVWDPGEAEWLDNLGRDWAKRLRKRGPRRSVEMQQVLPGFGPDADVDEDPILEAVDLRESGDEAGAWLHLMKLVGRDLRCIDAHVHLGNLAFDDHPMIAVAHYEVAVRLGEHQLGKDFDGVIPWGLIDNRPYLRALHGYGLCRWRIGDFDGALAIFERMVWLCPWDNLGARSLFRPVRARKPWRSDDEDVSDTRQR